MNAQAKLIHERRAAPPSQSLNAIPNGGLRILLSGGFIPSTARSVRFACLRDLHGELFLKVIAMDRRPLATTPELRAALASCFHRFMQKTRPGWPSSARPFEVWEWRCPNRRQSGTRVTPKHSRSASRVSLVVPPPPRDPDW